MASRFYYRPVDPGYDRFGATIANAVGAAGQTLERGSARRKEEERYREQLRREDERRRVADERYQDQQRRQDEAILRQYAERGMIPREEALELTPEGVEPGRGIYDSMGVARPVAPPGGLETPRDPRLQGIDPEKLGGGVSAAMSPDPQPTERRTTREDVAVIHDPRFGEIYVDPNRAVESVKEQADFEQQINRLAEERQRRTNLIKEAMGAESEGGEEITPEEMAAIENEGGALGPLDDLLLARERARLTPSRTAGGLTPNRELTRIEDNALGTAMGEIERAGEEPDYQKIADTLWESGDYAALGRGALDMLVREAARYNQLGISLQARRQAEAELAKQGVVPGTPGFREELVSHAAEIQRGMGEDPVRLYSPGAPGPEEAMRSVVQNYPDLDEDTALRVVSLMLEGNSLEEAHRKATRRERR